MNETRQHVTEVEIAATPDQVFRALTEAEQIMRWFAPEAKVEPGPDGNMVGGSYYISWGAGAGGAATIAIWEPGSRFAAFKERAGAYGDPQSESETLHRVMVDYQIEAIGGGKTRLRLVHSGFGRGAGWDNEFESTRMGWPVFMRNLKHCLERHPGVASSTIYVTVPCTITPEEAWKRLGLDGLKPGDRYSLSEPGVKLEGVVTECDPPKAFVGIAENLNDGLVSFFCGFNGKDGTKFVNATFTLWGPARERANQLSEEWTQALKDLVTDRAAQA